MRSPMPQPFLGWSKKWRTRPFIAWITILTLLHDFSNRSYSHISWLNMVIPELSNIAILRRFFSPLLLVHVHRLQWWFAHSIIFDINLKNMLLPMVGCLHLFTRTSPCGSSINSWSGNPFISRPIQFQPDSQKYLHALGIHYPEHNISFSRFMSYHLGI